MIIEKKSSKRDKLKLYFKGITPAMINALRRSIVAHVKTMAIDEVEIIKNSSAMYDEILAHRLGLIVLKTDLNSYVEPSKCTCGGVGCAKCTVELTLKAVGPGYVYASQLQSSDPKIKPVYPDTPIVYLEEGQEIELIAYARLGRGKDHAKWSPGHVWYKLLVKDGEDIREAEKRREYEFYIESWGQLTPKAMLKESINEILQGLDYLKSQMSA